jgi:hypothetical protein
MSLRAGRAVGATHARLSIMRNVHRMFLLGAALTLATTGYAQTTTQTTTPSAAAPCYGSTMAPPPTPSTPSLTGTPGTGLSTPNALASSLASATAPQSIVPSANCNPAASGPPPASTAAPPPTKSEPNTLGGVTVQPTNPNLSIGGLPATTSP